MRGASVVAARPALAARAAPWVEAAARFGLLAWCAALSAWWLLASVPFARAQFLVPKLYPPWLGVLLDARGAVSLALLAAAGAAAAPRAGWGAWLFWSAGAAMAGAAAAMPLLAAPSWAAPAAVAAWLPVFGFEWAASRLPAACGGEPPEEAAVLEALVLGAAAVFAGHAAHALLAGLAGRSPAVPALAGAIGVAGLAGRSPAVPALAGAIGVAGPRGGWLQAALSLQWALALQALLAVTLYAAWAAARAAGERGARWAGAAVAAAACARAAHCMAIGGLGAPRGLAVAVSAAAGAAMVAAWGGGRRAAGGPREPGRPAPRWAWAAGLAACAAAAPPVIRLAGRYDWDRAVQGLLTAGAWALAFRLALGALGTARRREAPAAARAWLCLAAVWAAAAGALALGAPLQSTRLSIGRTLQSWEESDESFRLARRFLGLDDPEPFYQYLRRHANVRGFRLPAGEGARARWAAPAGRPPDIFIIVMDSLRRDYLGAYNPRVRFTPRLDRFARESAVFRRAFAAYGGTALSVPSIWAGALIPHQVHPQPFGPIDALERLLEREGHRRFVTEEVTLKGLLTPSPRAAALQAELDVNFRLCPTLEELGRRLSREPGPAFAFVLAQDVHVARAPAGRGGAPRFDGFAEPFGRRIEAADACFGRFVDGLKRLGRWDDSIVVVTSDHGDLLGEDGRWGHATSLRPEVALVPLIVRVPAARLGARRLRTEEAALLTDLAPTLYELLGHRLAARPEVHGRPLTEPPGPGRSDRLIASSYGPVFGLVRDGRTLFVADALESASYLYDLAADPAARRNLLTPAAEAECQALLRAKLEQAERHYGVEIGP